MSVVPSFTFRYALLENLRKIIVNNTMNGAKQSTMSVSSRFSMNMAARSPVRMKTDRTMVTRMFVNSMDKAFVSLVSRVTSFPTGM